MANSREQLKKLREGIKEAEERFQIFSNKIDAIEAKWSKIQAQEQAVTTTVTNINVAKTKTDAILAEITTAKEASIEYADDIDSLVESAVKSRKKFDNRNLELKGTKSEADKLTNEIINQLSIATEGTLAQQFAHRQAKVEKELNRWRGNLYKSSIALVIAGIVFFIYSFFAELNFQFLLKITVSFPIIFAVWFSGMQYNKERRIVEEYAFKSATSKSLSAFSETLNSTNPKGVIETHKFLMETITKIFIPPNMEHQEDMPPEKVLKTLDKIAKLKDIIR